MPEARQTRQQAAGIRPQAGQPTGAEDRRETTCRDYRAVGEEWAGARKQGAENLTWPSYFLPPDHKLEPALPNVGPRMDDDVCAQIPAPRSQRSKQNSKHADHDRVLPALVAVSQAKHQSLPQYGCHNASAQCVELALQITAKRHFLADARGDRSRNPDQDFKQALRQQAIDGFRAAWSKQPMHAAGRCRPQHPERQRYAQVHGDTLPRGPAPARQRFEIAATAMHADPAVIKESPVHEDGDQVDGNGLTVAPKLAGCRSAASRMSMLSKKA